MRVDYDRLSNSALSQMLLAFAAKQRSELLAVFDPPHLTSSIAYDVYGLCPFALDPVHHNRYHCHDLFRKPCL